MAGIPRKLTESLHRMEQADIMELARIQAIDPKVRELCFPRQKAKRRK